MTQERQPQRQTARQIGAVSCHACHFLVMPDDPVVDHKYCPRCNSGIFSRKKNSINRTWALLVAAMILYIPANIFPIMTVVSFGKKTEDTIISGVLHLAGSGQWVIALVVFVASILVPIIKIISLTFLNASVQIKFRWRPKERAYLYRIIETIGRWSMVDIFMISILIGLVKLQAIATVEVGPGALAFAAVVILTMFAAMAFEPRLIWDQAEDSVHGRG
ncbi:MAG: paraquat-inducible protein A [Sneathiella sp.]|nr:paraquat-inducible protein A [Sneathiella sp.]